MAIKTFSIGSTSGQYVFQSYVCCAALYYVEAISVLDVYLFMNLS